MVLNIYKTDGEKIFKKSDTISFTQEEIVEEHEGLIDTLKEHQARMPKRDKKLDKLIKEQSKELAAYKRGEKSISEDLEKSRTTGAKDKKKRKTKGVNQVHNQDKSPINFKVDEDQILETLQKEMGVNRNLANQFLRSYKFHTTVNPESVKIINRFRDKGKLNNYQVDLKKLSTNELKELYADLEKQDGRWGTDSKLGKEYKKEIDKREANKTSTKKEKSTFTLLDKSIFIKARTTGAKDKNKRKSPLTSSRKRIWDTLDELENKPKGSSFKNLKQEVKRQGKK